LPAAERFLELPEALRPENPCVLIKAFGALGEQHPPLRDYINRHWPGRYPQCIAVEELVP
jgi:hypothetical protein